MPAIAPLAEFLDRPLPSPGAFARLPDEDERHRLLADMHTATAAFRRALRDQHDLFENFYRDIERSDVPIGEIDTLVKQLEALERRAWQEVEPDVRHIASRGKLYRRARHNRIAQSMARLADEMVDLAVDRAELFQNLRLRLLALASKRSDPCTKIFSSADEIDDYLRQLAAG